MRQIPIPAYIVTLILSIVSVLYVNQQPAFPDAFYHYNVAENLVSGDGFIDNYLWTYNAMPDSLPTPSNLYWHPGTAIVASLGMFILGASFASAQIGLIACLWGANLLIWYIAYQHLNSKFFAYLASLSLIFCGYFMRYWGTTDTFTPYVLFGALALFAMAQSLIHNTRHWWILAGIFSALAHLVRSDGLIMIVVAGWCLLIHLINSSNRRQLLTHFALFIVAYLVTMSPWFMRNLNVIGSPLPTGGTLAIWYTEYDDLFQFPPSANSETFFADGFDLAIESRQWAINNNLNTFIAVQNTILLAPFFLLALWIRRKEPYWRPIIWFTIGIYTVFTFLFPFPGVRGGLFHAIAAVLPFSIVLGFLGIQDSIKWISKYRRTWNPKRATPLFIVTASIFIIGLGWTISNSTRVFTHMPSIYAHILDTLPPNSRIMINDPAQLYYFTELGGVVIPNNSVDVVPEIAERYDVDYLIIENALPTDFILNLNNPPDFLEQIPFPMERVRVYAIQTD